MITAPNPLGRPTGLTFDLLGEVRCRRDGAELPLGAPRQRALLAVLLLQPGSPVSRDQLIDGIWGDSRVVDGANLVQAYVSKLRRLFEPDRAPRASGGVLTRIGSSYRLDITPDQCDLGRFESLRVEARALRAVGDVVAAEQVLAAALAGWRCPPLAGVEGPLLDLERARLTELRLATVEEHVELALEVGAHADMVPQLMTLAADHPYRERMWALLMVALYRSSRQADALAAYQRARHALMHNLGLMPGPDLRRIEEAILAGEPDPLTRPSPLTSPNQGHGWGLRVPAPSSEPHAPAAGHARLTLVRSPQRDAGARQDPAGCARPLARTS